ncbi:hypothetical protein, variant [Loa loa]|uniref:Uncharacterized protein n=1 Tax=Loa loa TaxID=7209 RepID=A0A1S0UK26_LOALO|nr:hypothetical protein, variant [Loa loa]EJD75207.1 hypothetical protein, variant [Loa loa]
MIAILFQFIHDLLIVVTNYFWNTDETTAHQQYFAISDTSTRIREMKRNEIVKKKCEDIKYLRQWPNVPKVVNAFTNVDHCYGEHDVTIYRKDIFPIDSGISSQHISPANTNETSSEDHITSRNGACHVSRKLTAACQSSFIRPSSRSSIHRSFREELSITRHVSRVRNAHNKRAKSAVAVTRHKKTESEMESHQNNPTFYDDFDQFYRK